ncbi:MAG TPA: WYL domain-containing protein [Longimicrobiales bacterium]
MTAEAQLERLLWLIPAASGHEGSSLEELAAAMQSTVDDVMRDVEALTARAYYQRAGEGDDLQVLLDDDRLRIWTAGELRRPARLTVREALALGIGLRAGALKYKGSRAGRMLNLARRLEQELAGVDVSELDRVHEVDLGEDPAGVRSQLERAARDRHVIDIDYLKAGASAPEKRRVKPYALVHAEGAWYVLGESIAQAGAVGPASGAAAAASDDDWRSRVRAFRVDRVLDVLVRADTFEVPDGFDVEEHLTGARVYRPHAGVPEVEVTVRYAPAVARWIRERLAEDRAWAERTRDADDGSLEVTHRVADMDWLVSHVLQYGPDAEVVAPAQAREAVAAAAGRVATG